MKKLISFSLFLITASLLVWSCSKTENSVGSGKDRHAARSAYLNSLYRQGYEIVREKTFFADGQNMFLTEIHPYGSQVTAYTVEKTGSYDLLYFLSYDPQTGQVIARDFSNDETDILQWNSNVAAKNSQLASGFDPFLLTEQNQGKRYFWGTHCHEEYSSDAHMMITVCCKYRFWIAFDCHPR